MLIELGGWGEKRGFGQLPHDLIKFCNALNVCKTQLLYGINLRDHYQPSASTSCTCYLPIGLLAQFKAGFLTLNQQTDGFLKYFLKFTCHWWRQKPNCFSVHVMYYVRLIYKQKSCFELKCLSLLPYVVVGQQLDLFILSAVQRYLHIICCYF